MLMHSFRARLLGAAAVLLLAAAAAAGDAMRADAGAGPNTGPVQNFSIDSAICYGSPPTSAVACPPGTDTAVTAGSAGTEYGVTRIDPGSRFSAPISYTPSDFTATPATVGSTIGTVTAFVDILCNGVNDVLSAGGPTNPSVGPSLEHEAGIDRLRADDRPA